MDRYLDHSEKKQHLEFWSSQREKHPCGGIGGHGFPDPEMFDVCDRLNGMDGVCTTQSCQGHREGQYESDGVLWLRLVEPLARRFYAAAPLLARHKRIISVAAIWGREADDAEVWEIIFFGYYRGAKPFVATMDSIVRFVADLAAPSRETP